MSSFSASACALHEALGLFQQRLFVDEVAADDAVLRYSRYPTKVRTRSMIRLVSSALLAPLLEPPLASARLEVPDVVEADRHERGGAIAPARSRTRNVRRITSSVSVADRANTSGWAAQGIPPLCMVIRTGDLRGTGVLGGGD
jgi:hypothetical protein